MAEKRQSDRAEVIATKRGFPIYDRNPSVPAPNGIPTRMKPVKIANGNRAMIIGKDTGELLGDAHAAFFEMQAVDQGQFVKIYLAGIKNTAKLTKAGMQVFEIVYNQMRENPQTDKIELNVYLAKKFGMEMSERTYHRGLRELLEKRISISRSKRRHVLREHHVYVQRQPHHSCQELLLERRRNAGGIAFRGAGRHATS